MATARAGRLAQLALTHRITISSLTFVSQLMLACYHGRLPLVQLLLAPASSDSVTRRPQVPSNPNALNDRLQSCLAGAIFKNEVEIVSLLLKHGADPDIGTPSATDTAKLFGKGQTWEVEFEQARKLVRAKREGGEGLIGR